MSTVETLNLEAQTKAAVIAEIQQRLAERYVFPDKALAMNQLLQERLSQGAYEQHETPDTFVQAVTADLQEASKDGHLRLYQPGVGQARMLVMSGDMEEIRRIRALDNYGLYKVERLAGNVGYLDIRMFDHPSFATDIAAAAMTFLADTNALIIDVTKCRGGSPQMVAFMLSYLVDGNVHINSFYNRLTDQTTHSYTLSEVPGKRFGTEKPVYVLTGPHTFSAGEEFVYDLQTLGRAKLVGEPTGGAAHTGGPVNVADGLFQLFVPTGRAINPITGTNWEGAGVQPDIAVPRDQALPTAHREALLQIKTSLTADTPAQQAFAEEIERALANLA